MVCSTIQLYSCWYNTFAHTTEKKKFTEKGSEFNLINHNVLCHLNCDPLKPNTNKHVLHILHHQSDSGRATMTITNYNN